ncbi:IS1595-like element ISPels1 family transposase, partial [Roseateles sp. DB2]
MRSRELKKMLAQAAKLTWPQRRELMQALSGVDEV